MLNKMCIKLQHLPKVEHLWYFICRGAATSSLSQTDLVLGGFVA